MDPENPNDFVIHGVSDIDGDGEKAHYRATLRENPTMLTKPDVY